MAIRYINALLLLFVLPLVCHNASQLQAQIEVSDYSNLTDQDYTSIQLPPIDSLFANAKNAPSYRLAEVNVAIEKKILAKEKRAVLGFFSLRGSYQYGMFGNESTYTDVSIAPYLTYSTQAQNGYTVGAGVNIPLDGLFDLKARVKRQKLAVQSAVLEKEVKFEEVKKDIIELYYTADGQLRVLKLRAESLELAKMQYSLSENDFINGSIKSSELSTDKQRQSDAQEAFEKSKIEFTKSLMILEVISNTKIVNK
jgi:outer membrane protein TolC